MGADEILRAKNLTKSYYLTHSGLIERKKTANVIDGVSFDLEKGKGFAVLGGSGSGKTTLATLLAGLDTPSSGDILLEGKSVLPLKRKRRKWYYSQVQMVFQDPLSSLNPARKIGDTLESPLKNFNIAESRKSRLETIENMLKSVGLNPKYVEKYPHEVSGGECQRVSIARALLCNPKILVLDEPVSGLDVSVQAQILNLLADLKDRFDLTYFLITSNPQVAIFIANRIAILYQGKFVEIAPPLEIYKNPLHPYTQILISASNLDSQEKKVEVKEEASNQIKTQSNKGCRFAPYCTTSMEICFEKEPTLKEYETSHYVACHFPRCIN